MEHTKLGFEEFIASVDAGYVDFVTGLHQDFLRAGCKLEVKEAKSGYVVSYLLNKKTVANYVFRKKGLIIRIYTNHILEYMDLLESLPGGMVKDVEDAPVCKRLLNSEDCNPRCAKGYDFLLGGRRYQKCRYSAFQFPLCEAHNPAIRELIGRKLVACGA